MINKLITFFVALIVIIVSNTITIYSLENISKFTLSESDLLKNIYYIFSMFIQVMAIVLGAIYFFKNTENDSLKTLKSKKNELLSYLVQELKTLRVRLDTFFNYNFTSDEDLKDYKDSITEEFTVLTTFIESNENIFNFEDKDIEDLLEPSSKLQNNNLFTLAQLNILKQHDSSLLKSEMQMAFINAYKACWKGIS